MSGQNRWHMYGPVKPPCERDCPDRTPVCRLTCERWKDYEARRADLYRQRSIAQAGDYNPAAVTIRNLHRKKKA